MALSIADSVAENHFRARSRKSSSSTNPILSCSFFAKCKHENCAVAEPKRNQRPVTTRSALPFAADTLLDDTTPKIGINQPALGAADRFNEHRI
jgi:hypothetical protein